MKHAIKSIDEYLAKWNLHKPIEISNTSTSCIYKVSHKAGFAVLKLLTKIGQKDEKNAAAALRNFSGNGAIGIYKNDEYAQLLEYIEGGSLTKIFLEGSKFEDIAIICATLRKLHQAKCKEALPHFSQRFSSLRSRILGETGRMDVLDELCRIAAPILEELLAERVDEVVLHGDLHHENVLYHPLRGWLAIDPKGFVGERTYDTANIFLNPRGFDKNIYSADRISRIANIIADEMNLNRDRILKFAFVHACLSACWSIEDGDGPETAIAVSLVLKNNFKNTIKPCDV